MGIIITGLVLGFWAGIAPGPLLALVVSESVARGFGAGARVALSPLITDIPIVALVLFASFRFTDSPLPFALLGLTGAAYLIYLGVTGLRSPVKEQRGGGCSALGQGVLVNLLNPHPYLFWLGVGAPLLRKAYHASPASAFAFVAVFYLMMIGTKLIVAGFSARAGSL
ncbi:MAG: LysE family transporter, partial [Pseudomonadota bacterium]|nr:LysE family transporter [Pseudomonadota bacterium]